MSNDADDFIPNRRREVIAWLSYVWVVGSALFLWITLAANQLLAITESLSA
ncbi:MAG: hypothetical protein AAF764_06735 [Pseudomonadota bacterium]